MISIAESRLRVGENSKIWLWFKSRLESTLTLNTRMNLTTILEETQMNHLTLRTKDFKVTSNLYQLPLPQLFPTQYRVPL
jgi:hypothetical protein